MLRDICNAIDQSLEITQSAGFVLFGTLSLLGRAVAVSTGTPDAAAVVRSATTGSVPTKFTGAWAIPRLLMVDGCLCFAHLGRFCACRAPVWSFA